MLSQQKHGIQQNAISLWTTDRRGTDGLFDLFWDNKSSYSCNVSRDTTMTTSALGLSLSASRTKQPTAAAASWTLFGLGNCMDGNNNSMSNFYSGKVNETIFRTTPNDDNGAIAYDYELKCDGSGFCRIRTLSDQQHTPARFNYGGGAARNVTRTNKMTLTSCYLRIK